MPCEHFMEKCALSHLARDRLAQPASLKSDPTTVSALVVKSGRICRLCVWPIFPITALAYWREMGCKCCPSAKCQCVMSSDHISVNKLCNPYWNATSDFCSTKKNTPLLSFKLKYSVFQFENVLMGFDTANGFWDRRARLCNVHFQGHSVCARDTAVSGRVQWPVPPSRVLAPHMCVAGAVGEMCDLYLGSGCFSTSQKNRFFLLILSPKQAIVSNFMQFYYSNLPKEGGVCGNVMNSSQSVCLWQLSLFNRQ